MSQPIMAGSTSVSVPVRVFDYSSSTGAGLGGLLFNTANLVAQYRRNNEAAWTNIPLVTKTLGTWVSGGFIANGRAGSYELGLPNAAVAAGATSLQIQLFGATNMLDVMFEIPLVAYDPQNATSLGISRLDMALSALPSGAQIANAVWNQLEASVNLANSMGLRLKNFLLGYTAAPTASVIADAVGNIDCGSNSLKAHVENTAQNTGDIGNVVWSHNTGTGTAKTRLEAIHGFFTTARLNALDWLESMIEQVGGNRRYKATALATAPTGSGGGGPVIPEDADVDWRFEVVGELELAAASIQYLKLTAEAFIGSRHTDATLFPLEFAFRTVGSEDELDWKVTAWDSENQARLLVGSGQAVEFAAGLYEWWVRVIDAPESTLVRLPSFLRAY